MAAVQALAFAGNDTSTLLHNLQIQGSNPNSLFHNSVKGKVIHPPGKSWGDFALNGKGNALVVDLQVPTDQVVLVRPGLSSSGPLGSGPRALGGISEEGRWR